MAVISSGIRATLGLHIGNLVGAIQPFADRSQNEKDECYFFVADLHTLTSWRSDLEIHKAVVETVAYFIAGGVDVERAAVFPQSAIPELTEIAWYLACVQPAAQIKSLPTLKDKFLKLSGVNAGTLYYPILMAADILGQRAEIVPVGADQSPHVEFARHLARKWNQQVPGCELPEPNVAEPVPPTVPGLTGGKTKMAKTEGTKNPKGVIFLDDPAGSIEMKVKQAAHDTRRQTVDDKGEPEDCNVFTMHRIFTEREDRGRVERECRSANTSCQECKDLLCENVLVVVKDLQEARAALGDQGAVEKRVEEVLASGAERARGRVQDTARMMREAMGIRSHGR